MQNKTCLSHEFYVWTRESKWQCKALLQLLAWCIAIDHHRIDVKFGRTLLSMCSLLIAFHNSATHAHSSYFVWSRSAAKNIKYDIDVKVTPGKVTCDVSSPNYQSTVKYFSRTHLSFNCSVVSGQWRMYQRIIMATYILLGYILLCSLHITVYTKAVCLPENISCSDIWPLLLTWFDFNPSMDN